MTTKKPTPMCSCKPKPDPEELRKLEAKVHRHAAALEQALAEIRALHETTDPLRKAA